MLSQSTLIAFIATANPKDSTHFYRDVLGLTLVEDSPPALVFDVNGTMLRIANVEIVTPAPYTVLGWNVSNVSERLRLISSSAG